MRDCLLFGPRELGPEPPALPRARSELIDQPRALPLETSASRRLCGRPGFDLRQLGLELLALGDKPLELRLRFLDLGGTALLLGGEGLLDLLEGVGARAKVGRELSARLEKPVALGGETAQAPILRLAVQVALATLGVERR